MKELEEFRKDSQKLFHEMMKILENDNVTNELFQIYQKIKDKKTSFNELAGKYDKYLKTIEIIVKNRHKTLSQIETLLPEFLKEKAGETEDSNRVKFLKQMHDKCRLFNECHSNR